MTRLYSIFDFLQIQLWNYLCLTRKSLTYHTILIAIETIYVEFNNIYIRIVFSNFICTLIVFCLSVFECRKVTTIEIVFSCITISSDKPNRISFTIFE